MNDTNDSNKISHNDIKNNILNSVLGNALLITCPITQKTFNDPVLASDGITYERHAIEEHFKNNNTSYLTGETLSSKILIPNSVIRTQINQIKKNQPGYYKYINQVISGGSPKIDDEYDRIVKEMKESQNKNKTYEIKELDTNNKSIDLFPKKTESEEHSETKLFLRSQIAKYEANKKTQKLENEQKNKEYVNKN